MKRIHYMIALCGLLALYQICLAHYLPSLEPRMVEMEKSFINFLLEYTPESRD